MGPLFAATVAIGAFKKTIDETIEAQNAMAQLKAALESTGGSAGVTAVQLNHLAESLQRTSTFTDDAVKGAEAVLLAFTNIKGAQLEEATQAVVNLSTRMGTDLKSAALQVGKALNDPTIGLTSLTRAGVQFSLTQQQIIKDLYKSGQVAEAQQVILQGLADKYGGAAEAARGTLGGSLEGLKHSFADLFKLTEANTSSTVKWINRLAEGFDWVKRIAERNVASFEDVTPGGSSIAGFRDPIVIHGTAPTDEERIAAAKEAQRSAQEKLNELERISAANARIRAEQESLTARIYGGLVETFKRVGEAAQQMNAVFRPTIDMGELRASIKANVDAAMEADKAAKAYAQDISAIWRQGISKIVTDGTKSFRDFFEDVLQMFGRLMARMEQEGKTSGIGYKMLGYGSAALGGAFAGYQVGQQVGGATLGALGGAAAGAAFGSQFGPAGAVIGGLTGFAAGLIGGGEAARAHAKALRDAAASFKQSMADFHAVATGTTGSLGYQEEQARRDAAKQRQAVEDQFPKIMGAFRTKGNEAAYQAALAAVNTDEKERIANLEKEAAILNKNFKEDLQVRLLRAQGQNAAADALALKQQQARELAALDEQIRLGLADAGTRALLLQVQAAELLKKSIDELTTSMRNAPSGFRLEAYVSRFAAPGMTVRGLGVPLGIPYSPQGGPTRTNAATVHIGTVTLAIPPGMDPAKVGPAFMTFIEKIRNQTVGPNAPMADALDYAPTS